MSVPGLRILTKYWKRYALVVLVGSCFIVTVKVGQQWMEDAGTELIIEGRALPVVHSNGVPTTPLVADAKGGPLVNSRVVKKSGSLSMTEMELRNAKLEAELKYEKLKAEMLNRDLMNAKKALNDRPVNESRTAKKETVRQSVLNPSDGDVEEREDDGDNLRLQERRRETIRRICRENPPQVPGLVRTVMKTRQGLTYCHIPGVMETFWLRVLRFVNRDYVTDPVSPFDITMKDAHERPFIRAKQLRWSRLSEAEKTPILKSKIFLAVQNPYMRLWEQYIHTMVLPVLWSTVGIQIEKKRKSNDLLIQQGLKRKACGKDVTFDEFVIYTLENSMPPFESYHRLCDPCQLNPTYVVKTETAQTDLNKVLHDLNLDYIVKTPNYSNSTIMRYLKDMVTDVWPRFARAKSEHCVTPGDIGKSLWKALRMEGLIHEAASPPLLDTTKTTESVLEMVAGLYIGSNLNVETQKARMMMSAYKTLSVKTKEAIKTKYKMDFQLFEYSENVDDVIKGL